MSLGDFLEYWQAFQSQRDVIAASVQVHQHKGTLFSVKQALASLAIPTQISEWTEDTQSNTPHSFVVSAFANQNFASGNENVLDKNFYQLVRQQVTNTKPVRSQFEIHLGAAFANELGMHMVAGAAQSQRHNSTMRQDIIQAATHLQAATCSQLSEISSNHIHPLAVTELKRVHIQLTVASSSITLAQVSMEAAA